MDSPRKLASPPQPREAPETPCKEEQVIIIEGSPPGSAERSWRTYESVESANGDHDALLSGGEAGARQLTAIAERTARRALATALAAAALCMLCALYALGVLQVPGAHLRATATAVVHKDGLASSIVGLDQAPGSWAGSGKCGMATNMLDYNEPGMSSFCSMDLDFWWNWAPVPRNAYSAPCAVPKFVPMIWGSGVDNKWIARKAGETFGSLMGYNEPDLWGPPPHPGDQYLSSGTFTPTFHCGSPDLAKEWRDMVMFYKQTSPSGTIVSPSMADPSRFASTGADAAACNSSPQTWESHMPWCLGWMKCFKENVIQLDCGGGVNCWDVIDVLQFHAYEYKAVALINKVKAWETIWADEMQGINGRRKKTLWLTEFARAGSVDPNDPAAVDFMEQTVSYMRSSPYVSGWSWFSQTFSSFTIDNITPASAYWFSELIDKAGQITPLGRKYQEICAQIPPAPADVA